MEGEGFMLGNGTLPCKSWAQQTEESYQLQMAMALRLSSQASAATAADTHFLALSSCAPNTDSAQTVSHRFWVNGCLSYFDRILDGFYLIHGMDPYSWTIGTDQREADLIPSYESLKAVDPCNNMSIGVILIDISRDPDLKELHNRVLSLLCASNITAEEVVHQLANVVCNHMGGVASTEEEEFSKRWRECAESLKDHLSSVVIPIGSLSVGLCVHRALLFKVLADLINLPCRIAKGCKYCTREDASSCLVQIGSDREYFVDLLGDPGILSKPDSSLNRTASVFVSSPLYHPRFKATETAENFRALARLYFVNNHPPVLKLDDDPSGDSLVAYGTAIDDNSTHPQATKSFTMNLFDNKNNISSASSNSHESSESALFQRASWNVTAVRDLHMLNPSNLSPHAINSSYFIKGSLLRSPVEPFRHSSRHETSAFSGLKPHVTNNHFLMEGNLSLMSISSRERYNTWLEKEGLYIWWNELVIKKKIGEGSFGTVHQAEWRNSDVAVKILNKQKFHADRFEEFVREVAIMKALRHPNIVLFMGAVTEFPCLSIVTEYLPRGCLYELLHMPDTRVVEDERLRLNMAYDVAKGMNYLHQCRPPIVHRDLKSSNLLVDSNYTVKVCDFGLSLTKANAYISSITAAGTPEWMAPEVLRGDPLNEKSDLFSFAVILWELVTLQKPWGNLTSKEVISAVRSRGKRLEIPKNVNPVVAALIEACWAEKPEARPSFTNIMETLQQLIMSSASQPLSAQPS